MNRIIVDYDQAQLLGLPSPIPSGQSQFSKILFQFSEEWKGLTKIAQFQDSDEKVYNVNFSEDTCFCPSELVPGFLLVRVKGYPPNSDSPIIATANEVRLLVARGFQSGGQPPVPPTPDLYQKLIEQFREEATVPLATYEVPGKVMPSSDFDIAADGTLSLYKAMAVQSVTTNKSAAYEIGTEVGGLELSWTLNKSPANLRIQSGDTLLSNLPVNARSTTELDGDARTLWTQLTASISQDMQFAVKATDARGVESSKSTAIRFLRYAYSKVGTPNAAPTTASECVKQADLATFRKNGADFTYTVGSCIWLLTTKQAAKIQTNVLGQWADVTTYGGEAVEFTQNNGTTATYYAYRTDTFTGAGTAKYRIV